MSLRASLACALAAVSWAAAAQTPCEPCGASWALELSGYSHHFQPPSGQYALKRWNDRNVGLGLEYRRPWTGGLWVKWTGGAMLDSTNTWSVYGGGVLQMRVLDSRAFSVDAGAGVFLFNRGFESGQRGWVAGPLPVLSLEHRPTGLGLSFSFVPKCDLGGRMESPATLYVQATYRIP